MAATQCIQAMRCDKVASKTEATYGWVFETYKHQLMTAKCKKSQIIWSPSLPKWPYLWLSFIPCIIHPSNDTESSLQGVFQTLPLYTLHACFKCGLQNLPNGRYLHLIPPNRSLETVSKICPGCQHGNSSGHQYSSIKSFAEPWHRWGPLLYASTSER